MTTPKSSEMMLDMKTVKKEMHAILKENTRLQTELKSKNETINTIINQNFVELKQLQHQHQNIVDTLTTTYNSNIQEMETKYRAFRSGFQNKLKDSINTYYRVANERIKLLNEHNDQLKNRVSLLQAELGTKTNTLRKTTEELTEQTKTAQQLNTTLNNLESAYKELYDTSNIDKKTLQTQDKELKELRQYRERNSELEKELQIIKDSHKEIRTDYLTMISENMEKQTRLDEANITIQDLHRVAIKRDKQFAQLTNDQNQLSKSITDLNLALSEEKKKHQETHNKLRELNNTHTECAVSKEEYISQIELLRTECQRLTVAQAEQIRLHTEALSNERAICNTKLATELDKYTKTMKQERDSIVEELELAKRVHAATMSEKEAQLASFKTLAKANSETQHTTFQELDKLRQQNALFLESQEKFDKKFAELEAKYQKEISDIKNQQKNDSDTLMTTYTDNSRKSQEMCEMLQTRLTQVTDALALAKATISNLKETNQILEEQSKQHSIDEDETQSKQDDLHEENQTLKDRLERAVDLNNTLNVRLRQYESQIKQLHMQQKQLNAKYGQLMSVSKND